MADVTNPGSVNVADEAFDGLPAEVPSFKQVPASASDVNDRGEVSQVEMLSIDQPVTVSTPATTALDSVSGDRSDVALLSVDQPVTKQVPASIALDNIDGGASSEKPISVDQAVTVQVPGEPLLSFSGDAEKPGRGVAVNIQQNSAVNIVNQIYGNGVVANVFVG